MAGVVVLTNPPPGQAAPVAQTLASAVLDCATTSLEGG